MVSAELTTDGTAEGTTEFAAVVSAVGGADKRGGGSWTMERCVKEGVSGQRWVSVSIAVSKYDPADVSETLSPTEDF